MNEDNVIMKSSVTRITGFFDLPEDVLRCIFDQIFEPLGAVEALKHRVVCSKLNHHIFHSPDAYLLCRDIQQPDVDGLSLHLSKRLFISTGQ